MSMTVIGLGLVVIVVSALLLAFVFIRAKQVSLTKKTEEKPEWMRSTPPPESIEATTANQGGVGLYHHEEGERLAAPFAEQLEDVLRARIKADPELADLDFDFGTGSGYDLEIWMNGVKYSSVDDLPSEKLKTVFRETIKEWNANG